MSFYPFVDPFDPRYRRFPSSAFAQFDEMARNFWSNWDGEHMQEEEREEPKRLTGDSSCQKCECPANSSCSPSASTAVARPRSTAMAPRSSSTFMNLWGDMNKATDQITLKLSESPAAYQVTASIPGFAKEQLNVAVKNGVLSVSGEVHEEKKEKNSYSKSSHYVSRSMRLPADADESQISAKHEGDHSALVISIKKHEKKEGANKGNKIMIE